MRGAGASRHLFVVYRRHLEARQRPVRGVVGMRLHHRVSLCHQFPNPFTLFTPTSHLHDLPNDNKASLNEGGDGMELSRAGAWDISSLGNSAFKY